MVREILLFAAVRHFYFIILFNLSGAKWEND